MKNRKIELCHTCSEDTASVTTTDGARICVECALGNPRIADYDDWGVYHAVAANWPCEPLASDGGEFYDD